MWIVRSQIAGLGSNIMRHMSRSLIQQSCSPGRHGPERCSHPSAAAVVSDDVAGDALLTTSSGFSVMQPLVPIGMASGMCDQLCQGCVTCCISVVLTQVVQAADTAVSCLGVWCLCGALMLLPRHVSCMAVAHLVVPSSLLCMCLLFELMLCSREGRPTGSHRGYAF
jgi:hypothetical protein